MVLYHGSVTAGIRELQPVSPLHGDTEKKVVYLTGSAAYALFYIWDAQHNKKAGKHVTCLLQNGVVYYEEQFDGQLRAFYQGVSGWLYRAEGTEDFFPVQDRESMWASRKPVPLCRAEFIPDVYEAILLCVKEGYVVVTQMPSDMRAQLRQHLAELILQNGWLKDPECEEACFYRTYFPASWQDALEIQ